LLSGECECECACEAVGECKDEALSCSSVNNTVSSLSAWQ
jgi:hypothetical protein